MASSSWRSSSSSPPDGPRAKCDQVVYEAIAKAAEVIVQARSPPPLHSANHTAGSSSARFNLHVAEIESVRSILQRWRRSLHVPLRLDVYYQHENEQRELLERWYLQYEPGAASEFNVECVSTDPLVQLRHVCKKIVVWLRSLYGMARMLPAHRLLLAHQKMHFSMDIEGVWQDLPQFRQESLPAVPTPYGPLYWRVWYAPNVNRLLGTKRIISNPIPMVSAQRNDHIAVPDQAQSAPAQAAQEGMARYGTSHPAPATSVSPHHRSARKVVARSHSLIGDTSDAMLQQQLPHRPVVQRSNSLNPDEAASPASSQRSGLSLAMEHRRTALHHPPPMQNAETYGYGYNHLPPTARAMTPTTPPAPLSSSPMGVTPPLSSTPLLFAGSHAPGPLIPPRSTMPTPPFSGLPTALSDPQLAPPHSPHSTAASSSGPQQPVLHAHNAATQQQQQEHPGESSLLPPVTSLDLLHSSPFKSGSILSSLMTDSDVGLKHSAMKHGSMMSTVLSSHHHVGDGDSHAVEEDDMPFAVQGGEDNTLAESAVASLARRCATASRLQLFESQALVVPTTSNSTDDAANAHKDMVSSVADQLAEFRTFGESLHVASPNPASLQPGTVPSSHIARRGSDASGNKARSGNEGSTSTLVSTRS